MINSNMHIKNREIAIFKLKGVRESTTGVHVS